MSALVWIHEDALRADHPAVLQAGDESELVFVWDDQYLQTMDYGFKRLVFIYETLCTMPVTIYRGDTVNTLTNIMQDKGSNQLYIPATPNPGLRQRIGELTKIVDTQVIEDVPFVTLDKPPNLGRFFRYWNKAKKRAMQSSQA